MKQRVLRQVTTAVTTMWLGTTGVIGPGRTPDPDPCGTNSGVSIDDFLVWDGAGQGSVPVRVPMACDVARTIKYETYDITARAGEDYVGVKSGTFVIQAGVTSMSIKIDIIPNSEPEPDKTFGVRLLSGAFFIDSEAVGTIYD